MIATDRDQENSIDASDSKKGISSMGESTDEEKKKKRSSKAGTPEHVKKEVFLASSLAGQLRLQQKLSSGASSGESTLRKKKDGSQSARDKASPGGFISKSAAGGHQYKKEDKGDGESELSIDSDMEGLPLFKKAANKDCAYCLRRELPLVLVLENCGHFFCPHCLI